MGLAICGHQRSVQPPLVAQRACLNLRHQVRGNATLAHTCEEQVEFCPIPSPSSSTSWKSTPSRWPDGPEPAASGPIPGECAIRCTELVCGRPGQIVRADCAATLLVVRWGPGHLRLFRHLTGANVYPALRPRERRALLWLVGQARIRRTDQEPAIFVA